MKIFIPLLLFFIVSIISQLAFHLTTSSNEPTGTTVAYYQINHNK